MTGYYGSGMMGYYGACMTGYCGACVMGYYDCALRVAMIMKRVYYSGLL